MKKLVQFLFIALCFISINSCGESIFGVEDTGPGDIRIKMVNKSNDLAHMFLSSQGEDFAAYNKLAHNESRTVDVSGLIWKDDDSAGTSGYIPVEVVIQAGQNGVVHATKTVMVSKVGTHTATYNGSSISYSE